MSGSKNISRRGFMAGAGALLALNAAPARAEAAPVLPDALWRGWRSRHLSAEGRVVDDGNGGISHSEGQGYGMLLAAFAGDREAFDAMREWTGANLMVRGDALAAWRYDPASEPHVADPNNATDGDILLAWALMEAWDRWAEKGYRRQAAQIARAVQRKAVKASPRGPLLLPGAEGFGRDERGDGPVINLSYWVFPAFPALAKVVPEYDWAALARSGVELTAAARFGRHDLPADWTALGGKEPSPAKGFPPVFGWNALRVPLYLAWSGSGTRGHLAPFARLWGDNPRPAVWNLVADKAGQAFGSTGYDAVPALVAAALNGAPYPKSLLEPADEPYYPATLRLLSAAAVATRYPACL